MDGQIDNGEEVSQSKVYTQTSMKRTCNDYFTDYSVRYILYTAKQINGSLHIQDIVTDNYTNNNTNSDRDPRLSLWFHHFTLDV